MSTNEINVLQSITSTLIDSCSGYKVCMEITEENPGLNAEFSRRHAERTALVAEFQNRIQSLGGTPESGGSLRGAVHRGFTRFASLFQDDQEAAISALDDGEEFLAEKIDDRLEDATLPAETTSLLHRARACALSGERMADALDD